MSTERPDTSQSAHKQSTTDFTDLRNHKPGVGRLIGGGFAWAREHVARGLIAIHVTADVLTVAGMVFSIVAGCCFAVAADASIGDEGYGYLMGAFWLLILASATDMLDGAVAKRGGTASKAGAVLDSSIDRVSDAAVWIGIGVYYARMGNVTYNLLALVTLASAYGISYVKARAENVIPTCPVGYWQRGERLAGILIATAAGNINALLVMFSIGTTMTFVRRVQFSISQTRRMERDGLEAIAPFDRESLIAGWKKILLWRWPRGSLPYDIATGSYIAWLIFGRFTTTDPLRAWLGW